MLTVQDIIFADIAINCAFCGRSLDTSDDDDSRYEDTVSWSIAVAKRAEDQGWRVSNNVLLCEKCLSKQRP